MLASCATMNAGVSYNSCWGWLVVLTSSRPPNLGKKKTVGSVDVYQPCTTHSTCCFPAQTVIDTVTRRVSRRNT